MTSANSTTSPRANAAIFYHPDGYVTTRGKLMGRHAAGEGFLKGFARHAAVDRIFALADRREEFEQFRSQVQNHCNGKPLTWIPKARPGELQQAGALYVPGPGMSDHAWQRQFHGAAAWSLTGITHTICSDRVMDSIGDLLIAPLHEWDALICTSPAVKRGAENMLAAYGDYLAARLGAAAVRPKLQLPVIPLGVDCDELGATDAGGKVRREFRRRNGIGDDEIVVLFLGRLSFHAKAHPLPMYQALQAAANATGKKLALVQVGWFANDAIKRAFVQGARALCPAVRNLFLDGRKPEIRSAAWHGSDIFCSLSDNVQETFGLTPVEAMAAGLPVVASDWNGYRGTVEHGVTGFLVPTVMPAAGTGEELAYRYFMGQDTYDQYIGHVSQCIAVDAGATARALEDLIRNPELRRKLGDNGRRRARQEFDWRVIILAYQNLWAELEQRRRPAQQSSSGAARGGVPLRSDPFAVFSHYPTHVLTGSTRITADEVGAAQLWRRLAGLGLQSFSRHMFAPDDRIDAMLGAIHAAGPAGLTVGELVQGAVPAERVRVERTVGWLFKMGVLRLAQDNSK
ncbi:MAG: glycosyltransferase family 4 protein [Gammaproteobacteria bacterium]|nr:glycosyltransferase family 4 protein [Gammaproteobacteria bacterium]